MEQLTEAAKKIAVSVTGGADSTSQEASSAPSKNALKKAAKEEQKAAEKERKKAEKEAREAEENERKKREEATDVSKGKYGVLPLIQSTTRTGEKRSKISEISAALDGKEITLRARVHNLRLQGKAVFFELRQQTDTIQALLSMSDKVSKLMYKFAGSINPESIILIRGTVQKSPEEIKRTTIKDAEILIAEIWVISESAPVLPFQIEDAQRPETEEESGFVEDAETTETEASTITAPESEKRKFVRVSLPTRLNNRVIDLRTTTSQAIFRIQSGACGLFREFLLSKDFVEIHTPKLLAAASEGGANVFKVTYFDRSAYLAQSPQLYKQMLVTSDFERVFEIAPVFRAENSFTHRHLTEFVGLDLEMTFEEHYHEVLELIEEMFMYIFKGFKERYSKEIETVRTQFPFVKPFELPEDGHVVRLTYSEGIEMLRADGEVIEDYADMSTPQEKRLGKLIKEKYKTDFYVLDKFPLGIRPFYTMPDPVNEKYSNSYDMFVRGEEIISGAQRVHDADLLAKRIKAHGVSIEGGLKDYVDAFRYGAMPHAGGGIGLERLVMLYLGIGNIRRASLFPRDPRRIEP